MASWDTLVKTHKPKKVQSVQKKYRKNDTREGYYNYIDKLNRLLPDDELREIAKNFGTKRKDVDFKNICRVVPFQWIDSPELLYMPKDNNILPELAVPTVYRELRDKLVVSRTKEIK